MSGRPVVDVADVVVAAKGIIPVVDVAHVVVAAPVPEEVRG